MKYVKIIITTLLMIASVIVGLIWGVKHAEAADCGSGAFPPGKTQNWYTIQEQARIDCQIYSLQEQIRTLENINFNLQKKVEGITAPAATTVVQPERVIETKETIVRDPDNTRVEALEKRVGALERAVSFIQDKVMAALTTTIGLLRELLKR